MRVAFVQNLWEEFPGSLILAEILEQEGNEVRFFLKGFLWFRKLKEFKPSVVAMSSTSMNHPWMLETAMRIKAEVDGPPVVILGGPHATFFPEVVTQPGLDAVCRGEGEQALPKFVAGALGRNLPNNVPNFWIKRGEEIHRNEIGPLVTRLDDIPIPRRRLYFDYPFFGKAPTKRMITSRGCPFRCTYCYNHRQKKLFQGKGPYLRRHSVPRVMDELKYLKKNFGFKVIEFVDDVFTLDREWFLEFAEEYRKAIHLPYHAAVHASHLDKEIADAFKVSGCSCVLFGIESGNQRLREEVMNRQVREEDLRNCARLLKEREIPFQTFNMVGLPGETLEQAFETVRINREIQPSYAWCSLAQPYPGTRLEEICREKGLLHEYSSGNYTLTSWFHRSAIDQPDRDTFINLQKFFSLLVKYPPTEPLVCILLKIQPNLFFRILLLSYFGSMVKKRNRLSWWRTLVLSVRNRKHA